MNKLFPLHVATLKPLALAASLALFVQSAQADPLYWDTNGTTAGAGTSGVASGTWNTSTANWTADSTGSSATVDYVPNSDVVFSAGTDVTGPSTITLGANETANSLTFNAGSAGATTYGFASDAITIGAGGITIGSGVTVNQGSTTFVVGASQTWTNNSSAAALNSSSPGVNTASGIGPVTLTIGGGVWAVRGGLSDSAAASGVGAGALTLDITNGSSWSMAGTAPNTYSGGTAITSGSYRGNTNQIGSGTITLGNTSGTASATVTFVTVNGNITNNVTVLSNGTSALVAGGGGNTYTYSTGTFTLGNTLILSSSASTATADVINDVITGTGGLNLNNAAGHYLNTLTLAGANTYSGGTTITSSSTLDINNQGTSSTNSALGTGALTINGGTIDNTSTGDIDLTSTTNNAVNLNGTLAFTGTHSLNLGTGAVSLGTASRTITVNGNVLTLGGVISNGATGSEGITKNGVGTLALGGANTYSGPTAVSAGNLELLGSISTGTVTVSGSTATFSGTGGALGAVVVSSGTLAPGTATATNVGTVGTLTTGSLSLTAATLAFDLGATNAAGASDLISTGALTLATTGSSILFDFNALSGTLQTGTEYDLINGSSISGDISGITTEYAGGLTNYTATYSIVGDSLEVSFQTALVPEPGTWALMLGGLALLVVIQRRKNKLG